MRYGAGQERETMTKRDHTAHLYSLREAIARSPILTTAEPPSGDFANWCRRQNADLDLVILDWLRSQAELNRQASLS